MNEMKVAHKDDLVTDWWDGGLYPRHLTGYMTGHLCCRCGHAWATKRVDSRIKYG